MFGPLAKFTKLTNVWEYCECHSKPSHKPIIHETRGVSYCRKGLGTEQLIIHCNGINVNYD